MKTICLTGKKGTGKSSLIFEISKMNVKNTLLFLADEYIYEIYQKDEIGYQKINEVFGSKYNDQFGIDRKKLAADVFNNTKVYDQLIEITNPLIREWIISLKEKYQVDFLIIELAIYLKFENYYQDLFDKVILIEDDIQKKENHVSDFLFEKKIKADYYLKKFEKGNCNNILEIMNNLLK